MTSDRTESRDEILERNVDNLLTQVHEPPRMSDQVRERVLARLRQRQEGAPTRVPTLPRRTGVWRGVLALAAMLALLWLGFSSRRGPGVEGEVHANTGAAPVQVELADGSRALLRGGARIEQVREREIRLIEGELVLDVVEHAEPFVVHTEHGRAVALGTRFSVRAEAERVATSVVRGIVRIESAQGEVLLHAGEHGALAEDSAPSKTLGERLSHSLAWARGALGGLDRLPDAPVRRGNLLARDPRWQGEWPLPIRKLTVDVHVENGVARTTIDQTFFNHVDRQLEGVYSFPLPSDAAISRLAMYVDGKLMEGGIVERQRGRDVYENIVYQRRDPALLEWMKGNEFRVRVFPLPPRQEKRVILSYTQELRSIYGAYRLQVPIPEVDLPVGEVEFDVTVVDEDYAIESDSHSLESRGAGEAAFSGRNVQIGDDLLLTLREREGARTHAAAMADPSGDYLFVRAHADFTAPIEHRARSWVVLYDTSASRDAAELHAQARLLQHFVHEIDEDDRLAVIAFDTATRTMSGGFSSVRELDPATLDAFLSEQARDAAGVTNLALGIDAAIGLLAGERSAPHILYLGDASVTEGTSELESLRRRVEDKATFVGVALGDTTDMHVLDALADASGGLALELDAGEDLAWRAFETIAMLNSPRVLHLRASLLDDDGEPLRDVQALPSAASLPHGDCASVLARGVGLAAGSAAAIRLEGELDGEAWSQTLDLPAPTGAARYLPRLWAQARIDAWLDDDADAHREAITALGLEHFLITPFTSLLVLENEQMYAQFQVTRPDEKGWAHYKAPATIEVVTEPRGRDPLADEATGDARVLRDPIQILQSPTLAPSPDASFGGTIGLGGLGLIGTGRGGGGLGLGVIGRGSGSGTGAGYGRGSGGGLGKRVSVSNVDDFDVAGVPLAETASVLGSDEINAASLDFARTKNTSLSGTFGHRDSARSVSRGPRSRSEARSRPQPAFWGRWGGLHHGYHGATPGVPYPVALHTSGDARLDDLTTFVPGMFGDAYDHAREALLAAAAEHEDPSGRPRRELDAAARATIDRARAAMRSTRYVHEDGETILVDAEGRLSIRRTTSEGLREHIVFDNEHAYALYDELGLAVRRTVGPTSPLLLGALAPWVMPPADHLARWYDVQLVGEGHLRLTPPGEQAQAVEVELDAQDRIVLVRRGDAQTRFEYRDDGLAIIDGGHTIMLRHDPNAGERDVSPVDEAAWTVVQLPLRRASHWQSELAQHAPGTRAWRDGQRQRMAAAAALGDVHGVAAAARELAAHVEQLTPGELVLASGGVSALSKADVDALLAVTADDASAIAGFVAAAHSQRRSYRATAFETLAPRPLGGLLATLADYRAALARIDRGQAHGQRRRIAAFVEAHGPSELAFVLVQRASQAMPWTRPRASVELWHALARTPRWKATALHSAGTALTYHGDWTAAASDFEQAFEAAIATGEPPLVDWQVRQALQSGRGEASFTRLWTRWRASVLSEEGLSGRIAFLAAARTLGEMDEIHRVVATLPALGPEHVDDGIALVDQLVAGNAIDDAWMVTRRLLEHGKDDASVLDRAATVSELHGRIADAAGYLERAMVAEASAGVALEDLRADYRRLIDLHTRLARSGLDDVEARAHRDHALRVASQWRREDPDNAEIDELCAALYPDEPALAWRRLSSIVERHPGEGSAWAAVARALEREGQLRRAETMWKRATEVEPTDPTWRLRQAESLAALGQEAQARALLDTIAAGTWQDRFSNVVWQAKSLRDHLRE